MGFSTRQIHALRRKLDNRNVRTREINGRELSYIEGWYSIAEANRIFGFDGWDRETQESRCVLAREIRGTFTAIYIAKVRVTVRADSERIVREGYGTGEANGAVPGEVHDTAIKSAETDATKRALATFGKPFGLALYSNGRHQDRLLPATATSRLTRAGATPIGTNASFVPAAAASGQQATAPTLFIRKEPSADVGAIAQDRFSKESSKANQQYIPTNTTEAPSPDISSKLDKHLLPFGKRPHQRDREHLKYVTTQPCLLCSHAPSDAHHLSFAQPRALGRKVSDEFTVPLCRKHHRELHQSGNEIAWWIAMEIDPLPIAQLLWSKTHPEALGARQ